MNSTILQVVAPPPAIKVAGILTYEEYATASYALAYTMLVGSLMGVVTNSINIRTFVSMGLDDGITVCLLGLAISDLGFTFFGCVLSSSNIVAVIEQTYELKNLPIHPRQVFSVFSVNFALMFLQISCLITTFMAIARCMCVAMPFQFKNYFSRSKSISALIIFVVIAMLNYVPLLSQMGAWRQFDAIVNKTRIVLWMSSLRSDVKDVVSFIHLVVVIFVSTGVVIVCVVIMGVYLRESVKFRHSSSSAAGESDSKEKSEPKLSGKELQVLRQVIVICTIYAICMLPSIFVALYRLADSDFDVGKRLTFFYFIASDIAFLFSVFNAASTFIVYYEFNTKFRSRCSSGWRVTKTDTK